MSGRLLDDMFEAYENTPVQGHDSIRAALRSAAEKHGFVLAKLPEEDPASMWNAYDEGWNDCLDNIEILEINDE